MIYQISSLAEKTITEFAAAGKVAKGTVGMYQAGFFPIMMFGLLGAAYAFIKTAKPKNRATITFFNGLQRHSHHSLQELQNLLNFHSYLLLLFYMSIHALLTGLSAFSLQPRWNGWQVLGSVQDLWIWSYQLKNPLAVQWWMLLVQGVVFFFLYFFTFTGLIKLLNLKTPGREDDEK